jgi:hypothetical protein
MFCSFPGADDKTKGKTEVTSAWQRKYSVAKRTMRTLLRAVNPMKMQTMRIGLVNVLMAIAVASSDATQSRHTIPVVKSGEMPLYPALARIGGIEGEVKLRVATDGLKVLSVSVENGQPILAKAAQDNVRSWTFLQHEPTVFSTRFSYHLDREESCEPDTPDNNRVILDLPVDIKISALHRTLSPNCNPNRDLDLSEPLKVFLTACKIDGAPIPCEDIAIELHSDALAVSPVRFKESEMAQGFVVPREFRSVQKFDVDVVTRSGTFVLRDVDSHFLRGKWQIEVDHAPFKKDSGLYNLPNSVQCAGSIHFQWGEPESILWHVCK